MLEDARGQRWLCDGGDDTHFATAARTCADVDCEHPTKSLHPAHRRTGLGEVTARMAIDIIDHGATVKDIVEVMPKQFLVYIRSSLMARRGISLPPLYEAFARASNNYHE